MLCMLLNKAIEDEGEIQAHTIKSTYRYFTTLFNITKPLRNAIFFYHL